MPFMFMWVLLWLAQIEFTKIEQNIIQGQHSLWDIDGQQENMHDTMQVCTCK